MNFDSFATCVGYVVMAKIAFIIILILIVMYFARPLTSKEKFSAARMSVQEGLPGPVWWYYPMRVI
jgi:hypothetical protein